MSPKTRYQISQREICAPARFRSFAYCLAKTMPAQAARGFCKTILKPTTVYLIKLEKESAHGSLEVRVVEGY